jgi:hypothetical protein
VVFIASCSKDPPHGRRTRRDPKNGARDKNATPYDSTPKAQQAGLVIHHCHAVIHKLRATPSVDVVQDFPSLPLFAIVPLAG